jgi:hypothetical protein
MIQKRGFRNLSSCDKKITIEILIGLINSLYKSSAVVAKVTNKQKS